MKKLILLILTLLLCSTASAEYVTVVTPPPVQSPRLTLLPSTDEVRVYATPSMKGNIIGYIIVGGQQEVNVLSVQNDWVRVSFTSVYGLIEGWIPRACFAVAATPTPTPEPGPSYPQSAPAYVVNPQPGTRLNLRAAPSANAASLGKYYTGAPMVLTGEVRNGFARVIVGSVSGWFDVRYITLDPNAFRSELPQVQILHPGSGANLRAGAGTSTNRIGWYPHGTNVTILGVREDEWYHVSVAGQTGFMSCTLLSQTFPWQLGADSDAPVLPDSVIIQGATAFISATGGVHLRCAPDADARSLGVFYRGCPASIISYTRTGWVYIRVGEMAGYVDGSTLNSTRLNRIGHTRRIINPYGTGLNLRNLPTTNSTILMLCRNYSDVTVLGDLADGWCYVQFGDQIGYMIGQRLSDR